MFHRLRHELRILGTGTFGLPVLMAAVFLGIGLLAAFNVRQTGGSQAKAQAHGDLALGLLFLVELGLPLVAGIIAANMVADAPAVELHLTLPRPYAGVVWLRLSIFASWITVVGSAAMTLVNVTGYRVAPQPSPLNQLAWAAPALWFLGAGAMLALLLHSRVVSGAILGMLWIGELAFRYWFLKDATLQKVYLFLTLETVPHGMAPDAVYWQANRIMLMALGMAFLALTALLLRRNEALLGPES